jgi:hypothetical protein
MHPFFLIGAVLHATAIAVLAFFILFSASKAEGLVRTLGYVLGIWVLIIAVLAFVGPAVGPMLGFPMMDHMRHGWMQPGQQPGQPPETTALAKH